MEFIFGICFFVSVIYTYCMFKFIDLEFCRDELSDLKCPKKLYTDINTNGAIITGGLVFGSLIPYINLLVVLSFPIWMHSVSRKHGHTLLDVIRDIHSASKGI